ncbi:MAG TPA: helix-turn-helix domain-containing protein, partial [Sphingobium sp.]|nr:helix-turn-helix domain-containing protein [Sphingobium sp.]
SIMFDPFASPWKPAPTAHAAPFDPVPPAAAAPLEAITDLKAAVEAHEAAIVRAALARYRYNQRATAKGLGLSYDQLRHCMKKHRLTGGGDP